MKIKILFIVCFSLICIGLSSWTWPLSNSSSPDDADTFTSPFGPRWLGYYDFHNGMDLQATSPQDVHASHAGYATQESGGAGGDLIRIESGSIRTYYMHLSERYVNNENVPEGYLIGKSGNSGGVPYHLHFEYRVNNDDKHPLQVMPYHDNYYCGAEMLTTDNRDFSFKLTIDDDELDIDIIDIVFIYEDNGFINEEDFDIDYSEEQYIPIDNNNIELFSGDWTMYVYPEDFNPDTDQEITYRFVTDEPEIQALSIEFMPITAEGWNDLEEAFYYQFTSYADETTIPINNTLHSNYPNPFKPSGAGRSPGTTISYSLAENIQNPKVEIYNVKGQKVKSFFLEDKLGENSIVWHGRDENDKTVSSGVYFYRLVNVGKTVQTRKDQINFVRFC